MNEFLIELQAKLNEAKSKGLINSDIDKIQGQLNKLKVQAEIDPNTISNLVKQLEGVLNQKITISNINIDRGNAVKEAQKTGREMGQQISNQIRNEVNSVIQKGNFTTWWDNKTNQDNFEIMQNEKIKKDIARLNESARQAMLWSDKVEKTKNGTKISGVKADKGAIGHKAAKMAKRSKVIESRINKAIIEKSKLLNNIEEQSELFFNSEKLSGNNLIELKDVSIYYNEKCVLKNISFNVEKGDRVAICGKNGGGKTSILKLMLGEPIKHSGTLYKSNKLKISYISQKYDWLDGTLINFASCNNLDKTKFLTMLTKLGFNRSQFDICINNFSEGQKKKVLIAKSLCEEANIYVWDEPLNYIDVISRIQIENLIKESNITLIFVEHDIAFINNLATKIINI